MLAASVSLSPLVVAQQVADNHVQQKSSQKVLNEKINAEATLAARTVTKVPELPKKGSVSRDSSNVIDLFL